MAFCVLLLFPAVTVRANALTDWENNLQITYSVGESGTYNVTDIVPVYQTVWSQTEADKAQAITVREFTARWYIPLNVTVGMPIVNAYNTGHFAGKYSITIPAVTGFQAISKNSYVIYNSSEAGSFGLTMAVKTGGNNQGSWEGAWKPFLADRENIQDAVSATIVYEVKYVSGNANGTMIQNLPGSISATVSYASTVIQAWYTYNEQIATEYGVVLRDIEKACENIKTAVDNNSTVVSAAVRQQGQNIVSSIGSAMSTLNNTLITWGSAIDTQIQNLRNDFLQYFEVDGSHDVVDTVNNTIDSQIKDYNKSESDLMSDASSKLDSVDTTDLSPLKAYEKATTFWTTAVRNLSESIGAFWYIYTFGAMIGLIAFILRLKG